MVEYTVYGRPGCGYCYAATRLLESKGVAFDYVDIYDTKIGMPELANIVGRAIRTVPQILHGKQYVGGYTDLVPYLEKLGAT